jgi:L-lactate utilization protein LutB
MTSSELQERKYDHVQQNMHQSTYLGSRVSLWISLTAELAAYKEIFLTCTINNETCKVSIFIEIERTIIWNYCLSGIMVTSTIFSFAV